jgi:hypothetical protein
MKFDPLHWIQATMMLVIGGAGSVAQAVPQWSHVCVPIIAGAVGILGAVGMVSHSIMGTTVPNPAPLFTGVDVVAAEKAALAKGATP